MSHPHLGFAFLLAILSLAWPGWSGDGTPTPLREETLILGKVSDNPRKVVPQLTPLVTKMADRLNEVGIRQGRVLLARNNAEMIQLLQSGRIDWVSETPSSAFLFAREAKARIALRSWRGGKPNYHSVLITRRNGGVTSLADLAGKRLALEDPGSSSGFVIPLSLLRMAGLNTLLLTDIHAAPPAEQVGYALAGGELNIAAWVAKGLADAGALSSSKWEDEQLIPPHLRAQLVDFHHAAPVPRALELFRADLPAPVQKQLTVLLAAAHTDPKLNESLATFGVTRFEPITPAIQQELEAARPLFEIPPNGAGR